MSEYFATSVSYSPVPGDWRSVLVKLLARMKSGFGLAEMPRHVRWVWVDPSRHFIADFKWLQVDPQWYEEQKRLTVPTTPPGQELWLTLSSTLDFSQRSHHVDIRVRAVPSRDVCVELWFGTEVHMAIFCGNINMNEFDADAKAALVRLLLDVGRTLGAEAFGYRVASEDSLFGPPDPEAILKQLDRDKWRTLQDRYYIAGMQTARVPAHLFEPDADDPPWHYRRAGYDIYDSVWPDTPDVTPVAD
jgi:hypothetical protein